MDYKGMMWKGKKFKIYGRKFGRRYLIGKGVFIGKEKIWVSYSHGFKSEFVAKFKVNGSFIYGNSCEYECIEKKDQTSISDF